MSFKIKPVDGNRPGFEAETAREAINAVQKVWQDGGGAAKVEIEDERTSPDEETASERDLMRRQEQGGA
ncbi:hypothetical protein J2T09_003700 [Neorhizobium huautlense]|uniref:DUF2188 domain-containing protein n=1 Tax=Neorhizobium huautlense TaxID=67774 RepID=A0ABT9PWR5_9HYPH|nr:hypothetical protein [Neorhizobium huautlense]MDP9838928.1 hypothetical protein [Neorhizobium huautlense]